MGKNLTSPNIKTSIGKDVAGGALTQQRSFWALESSSQFG